MSAWVLYNCVVGLCLAIILKLVSRFEPWKRRPNLLLLGWFLILAKLTLPPVLPLPVFQAYEQVTYFSEATTKSEFLRQSVPQGDAVSASQGQLKDLATEASNSVEPCSGQANGGGGLGGGIKAKSRSLSNESCDCSVSSQALAGSENKSLAQSLSASISALPHLQASLLMPDVINLKFVALAVWLAGAVLIVLMRIRRYRTLNRLLACGGVSDELCQKLRQLEGGQNRCLPSVMTVEANISPALVGLWRQKIVLPSWAVRELSPQELSVVLQHELQHHRRHDTWLELMAWVLAVIVWWNPCAWWAYRELRMAQELCCDAAVIRRGFKARDYALALMRVLDLMQADGAVPRMKIVSLAVLSRFSSSHLESRIRALGLCQGPKRYSMGLLVLVLGLVAASLSYPTLAEHRRFLDSFRYQPLSEVNDPSAFRELNHQWPSQVDADQALRQLSDFEVLARGYSDFGDSGRPLIMAVLQPRSDDGDSDVNCLLAVDLNRDEQFSREELFQSEGDSSNSWFLQVSPNPPSPGDALVSAFNRATSPLAFQSQHDTWLPEYRLQVQWQQGRLNIGHAARLVGRINWQGQSFAAELLDRNCNGLWTDSEDRLYIDWDGDGRFSPLGERYSCQQEIVRSGIRHCLAFSVDKLTLEPVIGTGTLTLQMELFEEDARVEELKALLVSQSGIHVTGTRIETPIALPVGEYCLKALSFKLVGEQVWHYSFVADSRVPQPAVIIDKDSSKTMELLGEFELTATVVAGRSMVMRNVSSAAARSIPTVPSSELALSVGVSNNTAEGAQQPDSDSKSPGPKPTAPASFSSSIIQPILRSESGLYLVRCGFGDLSDGSDRYLGEESRLIGIHLERLESVEKIRSLTDSGFACGTFCPMQFDSSPESEANGIFRLQFDSGPAAGLLTADLKFGEPNP